MDRRFIRNKKFKIDNLNLFVKCSECEGRGAFYIKDTDRSDVEHYVSFCNKCNGNGKLLWIEDLLIN